MLEWIFDSYWYWFLIGALLLLLELIIPGTFLLWLGLGATAVGLFLLVFPQADLVWQLLALICSMSGAVAIGLRWQKKMIHQQPNNLNLGMEGYIGRSATVSQPFVQGRGRIRIDDSSFPAISSSSELSSGQRVTIIAIDDESLVVQAQV